MEDVPIWVDETMHTTFIDFPKGGEVIDVGCGFGRCIDLLPTLEIEHYFGIDPSTLSIDYCRERFPQHQFEVEEIRTIGEKYGNKFDGFFLLCVLMHLPRHDVVPALKSLRLCLKSGATGIFSVPKGEGGFFNRGIGITLTLFQPQELRQYFEEAGFKVFRLTQPEGTMVVGSVLAV